MYTVCCKSTYCYIFFFSSVGEEEELRGLLLGASDLERKLQRALDEINRLNNKTDNLIDRQKQIDEQRRLKMLEEAKKNEALNLLIKDLESLDLLLKDLTEVRKEYMQAEGLFRKIQKMKPDDDQEDEMDTDEMTLDSIRVDTQSATDGILKTRENIAKVQDDYLVQMDEDIDIVAEEEYLKRKILDSAETVKKLSDDVDSFLKNQKEKYDGLMKKKALNDEEEKLRREKELQLQEELERERQRLENERKMREEEQRRRREAEQRMRDLEDQDRLRAEEEEKRRQKELEDARKKKEMDEKMAQLQQMLDEEAEKNRAKQKQEILFILEGDTAEIERMKDRVLILVDKQKNIGTIKSKRRKLYTIPEENEIEDEEELKDLLDRTSQMFNTLSSSEKEIESLRQELDNCLPADVLDKVVQFEQRLGLTASELDLLSSDMDRCNDRHLKMLADGEKALEEEALRQQKLKEDEERLNKMKGEIDMMKFKDIQLRKNIATSSAKTEEEKSENDKDLSLLQNKKSDLSELENSIFDTSQDFEKWKDFTWNEEEETEMNRFGMVGSTSMPTFPEFLIQNPALREKIEARRMEMKRLQENIKKEAARMKEISEVLDEMDRKRREAELRRLAEQSMEWTQDYIPSGSAEFGAMPVFR